MARRQAAKFGGTVLAMGLMGSAMGCSGETPQSVITSAAGGSASSDTTSGGGDSGSGGSGAFNPNGSGGGTAGAGAGGEVCENMLSGVIRDFSSSHPDFEGTLGTDKGIVEEDIGSDQKPVYAGNPTTPTTNGEEAFDQWYRDVDGVNMTIPLSIPLTDTGGGIYTFDDSEFFPIDGQGFGDEGNPHNYHFTYEIHAEFTYEGGEVFTFTGDDDLFAFINGKLAIDLGGVHGPQSQTIDLDQQADALGIVVGGTYPLAFFFAERHTVQSNFRIDTTIGCFSEVPIPQ